MEELSRWYGISPQATGRQHDAVAAPVENYWLLFESVRARCKRLSEFAGSRKSYDGKYDVAAESAKLKRAQRERVELDLAERRGELIDAEAALVVYGDMVREVRQAILSIPARIHGDLPHMVPSEVEVIKRQCRETLAELKRLGGKPPRVEAGAHRRAKRVL
jgi:phage terminase Nu1 subunit (DNA packaging protein)